MFPREQDSDVPEETAQALDDALGHLIKGLKA